jgi:hypothetical protein
LGQKNLEPLEEIYQKRKPKALSDLEKKTISDWLTTKNQ